VTLTVKDIELVTDGVQKIWRTRQRLIGSCDRVRLCWRGWVTVIELCATPSNSRCSRHSAAAPHRASESAWWAPSSTSTSLPLPTACPSFAICTHVSRYSLRPNTIMPLRQWGPPPALSRRLVHSCF